MAIKNAIASLAVSDLSASIEWYGRLLGRPADSRPMQELAEWEFERGGWLQLYQNPERAGSGSLTLAITSLEEQVAQLHEMGLSAGAPIINETVKVLMIKDLDGNSIAFSQALDPTIAQ